MKSGNRLAMDLKAVQSGSPGSSGVRSRGKLAGSCYGAYVFLRRLNSLCGEPYMIFTRVQVIW